MNYHKWHLDPVTKNDYITVRCYTSVEGASTQYLAFDYTYDKAKNIAGACELAKQQINVIEEIIALRCETLTARS